MKGYGKKMSEKCNHAYRRRGDKAVRCKAIKGDMDYCGHSYFCHNSKRWEVNPVVACVLKHKAAVK